MDGERVGAVFEAVLHLEAVGRQFARLPDRDKPRVEPLSQNPAIDEAARFDAHHLGDALPCIIGDEVVGDR